MRYSHQGIDYILNVIIKLIKELHVENTTFQLNNCYMLKHWKFFFSLESATVKVFGILSYEYPLWGIGQKKNKIYVATELLKSLSFTTTAYFFPVIILAAIWFLLQLLTKMCRYKKFFSAVDFWYNLISGNKKREKPLFLWIHKVWT